MDLFSLPALLKEKCLLRGVSFQESGDFFRDPMLGYVRQTWSGWLGPLVPELPEFDIVIDELRPWINILFDPGED